MPDTLNLIEEKGENGLELICKGKDFLRRAQLAQALKLTIKGMSWNLKIVHNRGLTAYQMGEDFFYQLYTQYKANI